MGGNFLKPCFNQTSEGIDLLFKINELSVLAVKP